MPFISGRDCLPEPTQARMTGAFKGRTLLHFHHTPWEEAYYLAPLLALFLRDGLVSSDSFCFRLVCPPLAARAVLSTLISGCCMDLSILWGDICSPVIFGAEMATGYSWF